MTGKILIWFSLPNKRKRESYSKNSVFELKGNVDLDHHEFNSVRFAIAN